MSRMNRPGKKNALLLRKEKLLKQIKLCEKQIEQAKQIQSNNNLNYDDSSDSDTELSLRIDKGKSLPSLVRKKSALQTRCNATAELTCLEVLESTINILTENPDLNGEPPITEDGVWHEVIAECKVDLIPFTISFYVHQPNRTFSQPCYRCLKVVASKQANEKELSNSVLNKMTTPSDAFEVLKSYAAAHRSRRTTLARLAEMYGDELYMTPLSEGGYQLQCANILELSWTLESKSSTVAYFRHRMKLSLEYMDEASLKIITQANKEMSNPSVDTDERTLLLSKIISTCLKEGAGSEARVQKRSNDGDIPIAKKKKESEVMGPPKTLPKKNKIKDKVNNNTDNNKTKKVNKDQENEIKSKVNSNKNINVTDKIKNKVKDTNISNKDKNIKNPIKDNKTNESNAKINKDAIKTNLTDNSKNKVQKTDKNTSNKDIEKSKDNKNPEKGKKVTEKAVNKENKNSQINKFTNSNEKIFPQTKRINLKPNMKKDQLKNGNTLDLNKRFSGNIKEKLNLQKTKIPMKMKDKVNQFRISPRTLVKNPSSVSNARDNTTNIARFIKKPSVKKI